MGLYVQNNVNVALGDVIFMMRLKIIDNLVTLVQGELDWC